MQKRAVCKKDMKGVHLKIRKEHKIEYKLVNVDMGIANYDELYQYDFCEHCSVAQIVKED